MRGDPGGSSRSEVYKPTATCGVGGAARSDTDWPEQRPSEESSLWNL